MRTRQVPYGEENQRGWVREALSALCLSPHRALSSASQRLPTHRHRPRPARPPHSQPQRYVSSLVPAALHIKSSLLVAVLDDDHGPTCPHLVSLAVPVPLSPTPIPHATSSFWSPRRVLTTLNRCQRPTVKSPRYAYPNHPQTADTHSHPPSSLPTAQGRREGREGAPCDQGQGRKGHQQAPSCPLCLHVLRPGQPRGYQEQEPRRKVRSVHFFHSWCQPRFMCD